MHRLKNRPNKKIPHFVIVGLFLFIGCNKIDQNIIHNDENMNLEDYDSSYDSWVPLKEL